MSAPVKMEGEEAALFIPSNRSQLVLILHAGNIKENLFTLIRYKHYRTPYRQRISGFRIVVGHRLRLQLIIG